MNMLSRWIAPLILAIGVGATAMPAPAQAQDDLTQVLVEIADVVMRGDTPYYRYGDYGYDDRLTMRHDRHGRPIYYRSVPRYNHYRGNAYGHRDAKCNKHGKCKVEYYSPRHDRDRYARYDRRDRGYRDDRRGYRDRDHRRWRDDDDD